MQLQAGPHSTTSTLQLRLKATTTDHNYSNAQLGPLTTTEITDPQQHTTATSMATDRSNSYDFFSTPLDFFYLSPYLNVYRAQESIPLGWESIPGLLKRSTTTGSKSISDYFFVKRAPPFLALLPSFWQKRGSKNPLGEISQNNLTFLPVLIMEKVQ
jgi:hypothetical protein